MAVKGNRQDTGHFKILAGIYSGKGECSMLADVRIRKKLGTFQLDMCFASASRRIGILGASGCGKSMTLKCIAGIETPDEGMIQIGGRVLYDAAAKQNVKPQLRRTGYLFQNYALFPSMTAAQNIGAGLKGTRKEKQRRIDEMIERFHLNGLAGHLPSQLSGGQQQRVALARIMACQPEVLLLDEPFSAMDVFLKDQLQQELQKMLEDYPGIVILVSHSRDEIYRFCEELVIAGGGKKIIQGRTKDIFTQPVYKEAARLTGCKNFSKIRICNAHTVEASDWGITLHFQNAVPADAGSIGFRAHDFVPVWGNRTGNSIRFHAVERAELPFEYHYYFMPENGREDETHKICWFVLRGELAGLEQRGMPDYLRLPENKIMFLKD